MENKGHYINELPQSGEVTFLAVVIEKEVRPKRNGGNFLAVRFADRSGGLDGKVWDNPEAVAQLFDCDDVVKVRGTIDHYNDKPQLIVSRIRRCEPNEYNAADFYPASRRDPDEMLGELQAFVAMVRDEALQRLLESIVGDSSISQRLKTAPAAMKIHHAFRGGLLEHMLALCNLATALSAQYPRLNLDWLIGGAILHDLGKIEALEASGLRFTYTTRGQLLDHVALGLEILERHVAQFPGFPLELKTILQHFVVSHHGELDKGALRTPMFPEAQVLNLIDLIDARLEQAFRLLDQTGQDAEFTAYVPSLERQLFRGFGNASQRGAEIVPGDPQSVDGGKAA
jgi:3'-5' exoribonuclease